MTYSSSNPNKEFPSNVDKKSWWVEQWMELINSYRFKKRLERAWSYAREGNVTSIRFEGRRIHARVQGTDSSPYKVKLWLDVLTDEDWEYVLEAMAKKARWTAQLLAGTMPQDIETAFAASGKRLFPFKLEEIKSECSCPDKANPCKHISAVYYLMGDRFEEDPFILFQLRGRNKDTLVSDLAKKRCNLIKEMSLKGNPTQSTNNQQYIHKETLPLDSEYTARAKHWWEYNATLDSDLVIITSSIEGESGLIMAGELPLAIDPKFAKSHEIFIESLQQYNDDESKKAMITAMSGTNSTVS